MQFEAIALSEIFPKGRKSGYIKLESGAIKFYVDDAFLTSIRLNDTDISRGGTGNRFIYFKDKTNADLTFYTDDLRILNQPELQWFKNTAGLAKGVQFDLYKNVIVIALFVLFIIGAVGFMVMKSDFIIEKIADLVPRSAEEQMSETLKESALDGKKIINDSFVNAQIALITNALVTSLNDTSYHFTFTVIEDEEVNAFALPGGPIVINSGLLLKADNAEEIAGVLAHEISHITRRHHVRGLVGNLGVFMVIRGLVGDLTGISANIINVGASLGSLKYSRGYETESDEYGMQLIQKANINPNGMVSFFKKLAELSKMPEMADFISTHPSPKNRIKYLQSMIKPQASYTNLNVDVKKLKQRINQLTHGNKN
jgi:beta-barrel assembly-enhancing protease